MRSRTWALQEHGKLMAGMVGGGVGADIGKTHRFATRLDDHYVLTAGIFGQNEESSAQLGASLGIAEDRVYASYAEMARAGGRASRRH